MKGWNLPRYVVRPAKLLVFMISGIRRSVNEICTLLGCYAAQISSLLPTFRDKLSILSSNFKQPFTLDNETSVTNYQSTLRNIPQKSELFWLVFGMCIRISLASHGLDSVVMLFSWCVSCLPVAAGTIMWTCHNNFNLSTSRCTKYVQNAVLFDNR